MVFTKDDVLFYIDNVRWEFRNSSIKASAVCDIIYAAIEDSEDVLYQQGYDKAKEDMLKLLEEANDLGWREGQEALRNEIWEDGRDKLD